MWRRENDKLDYDETGRSGVQHIHMIHDRDHWHAVLNRAY